MKKINYIDKKKKLYRVHNTEFYFGCTSDTCKMYQAVG